MRDLRVLTLILALTSLLFLATSGLAQEVVTDAPPPAPTKKKPLPLGSIIGHVTCADTHRPARGARIMLFPLSDLRSDSGVGENEQPSMGITSLDGSFLLEHVAPGEYAVLAFAAGYLSPLDAIEYPGTAEGDPSQRAANELAERKAAEKTLRESAAVIRIGGAETGRIDIELQRGAILTGKVLYADGAPASQLRVMLQKTGSANQPSDENSPLEISTQFGKLILHQSLTTDDQGHFRISGIPPGSYRLAVAQKFDMTANDLGQEMEESFNPTADQPGQLTIYSGNTLHRKDAKTYDLRPGDTVDGIEIVLPLTGLHSIRGTVTAKDGAPLNSGMLTLIDASDPAISFYTPVQSGGQFHISNVPEGAYQLKTVGGRIYDTEHPGSFMASFGVQDPSQYTQQLPLMDQQLKPSRAFADTTIPVIVQSTDIDNLTVTLPDIKLPDPPKQPDPSEPIHGVE